MKIKCTEKQFFFFFYLYEFYYLREEEGGKGKSAKNVGMTRLEDGEQGCGLRKHLGTCLLSYFISRSGFEREKRYSKIVRFGLLCGVEVVPGACR